jgi:hypothetical protein
MHTKFRSLLSAMGAGVLFATTPVHACTIFSAVAPNGQVWTGNNEDGPLGVPLYLNVIPKIGETRFGYFTLTYESPEAGIQGGMNEAGLTYDFNALRRDYPVQNSANKKPYPRGDDAILDDILANFATTEEVVQFFESYWFESGFERAQMHVADKHGTFAIITPSGSQIFRQKDPVVSTNYNFITGDEADTCWRFPLATKILAQSEAGLATMTEVCQRTAQNGKGWGTLYSNVQNLKTGEIILYRTQKFQEPLRTSVTALLAQGRRAYQMKHWNKELPLNAQN